jgi:nucleotide-binding universal stress UspA family protein
MTILVAVTDSPEGQAALTAAAREAATFNEDLVAVNLTSADLDTTQLAAGTSVEVVVPPRSNRDEVEEVLQVVESRSNISRLVVGVRRRSPVGKAVLGSIAQRLILEAPLPVLAVRASEG